MTHAFPSVSAAMAETCNVVEEFPLLSVVLLETLKIALPEVMVKATFNPAVGAPFVRVCVLIGMSTVLPWGTQILGAAREMSNELETSPSKVVCTCCGDE